LAVGQLLQLLLRRPQALGLLLSRLRLRDQARDEQVRVRC